MKHKLKNILAWLLVLLQCVNLLPISALAAGGSISSSFTYDKTDFYITVKDVYYDTHGEIEKEDIRQTDKYAKGDSYSYDVLSPLPVGFEFDGDETVSGVVSRDTEIVFKYYRPSYAYVTVSYSKELCDYLNDFASTHDWNKTFSPSDIIQRKYVDLGDDENSFYVNFDNLADDIERYGDYMNNNINISSFRTYYYDYDKGWTQDCYYVGYPVDGLSADPYIEISERNEGDIANDSPDANIQNYTYYELTARFPSDINVYDIDADTKTCCHIVLGMDGFNLIKESYALGVYRTVLEDLDAEDDIEKWYTAKEGKEDEYWFEDYRGRYHESCYDVKDCPEDFIFAEDGVCISQYPNDSRENSKIYYGKDKDTNEEVIRFANGKDFTVASAPLTKGYKCTNPDSPREFECVYRKSGSFESTFICYYYDYVPAYKVTVKDVYSCWAWDSDKEEVRQTDMYEKGESYTYKALDPIPKGYELTSDEEVSGIVSGNEDVIFNYEKIIPEAKVTVSYSEALCDYLNGQDDSDSYNPSEIIESYDVQLGIESEESLSCNIYLSDTVNISSFHTYYYTDEGWSSGYYYLGYPVEGALSADPYITVERNDNDPYKDLDIQCSTYFDLTFNFPEDLLIEEAVAEDEKGVCCHIVLDIDGINLIEEKSFYGVYRTFIEELDSEDNAQEWYCYSHDTEGTHRPLYANCLSFVENSFFDFWYYSDYHGKSTILLDGGFLVYTGRDIKTNEIVSRLEDGTEFEMVKAPTIEGYKCTNPDEPRKRFNYMGYSDSFKDCYYYDYIPTVTYTITIKDKFIDESGAEEKTDIRKTDYIPEGDGYTYESLDPIPDGYKLVSDPTVTDTASGNKEIVFIYQKMPQYTITVKDVFTNESGVEENTAIRQKDKLYEDSSYHYSALSPVPEGYELTGVSDYAGKASKDIEIVFTYRKKIVVPNTYAMIVKDKYIDVDGSVIRIDERVNTTLNAFEQYNFTALNPVPEGYEIVGASGYAGNITSNTEIIFVYQKKPAEKPVTYTFKVVDEYYDADGNVIKTVERTTDALEEGSEYVCTALKPVPDGYVLISDEEYRGIISEDTVIVFKYKDASVRLVTVKGYLKYKNGEPVANSRIELHSSIRTAVTDADGYYEITGVETGSHKLSIIGSDGADLVTCGLSITKPNEDSAVVTYKAEDAQVSIDLSVTDVLKIDVVLPLYKLEVIDKYYDSDNSLIKSELRESLTAVKSGTAYAYDALSPEGYTVTSEKNYSGVVTSDTTVIFTYRKDKKPDDKPTPKPDKKPSPETTNYTVTVIDNYYDANALLIDSVIRLTETKSEGDSYYYDAKILPDFTLIGADHYSDFVHSNITLAFAYKADAVPQDAVVTVIDRYVDEDDSTQDDIRLTETKKIGDPYHYEAIPVDGYELAGSSSYSGVVMSHLTLIFTYQKPRQTTKNDGDNIANNEYTVTVIDKYITDIPLDNFIIDKSDNSGVSDGLNNFNTYSYSKENGKYMYMVKREVRCRDAYMEGSSYKYSALEHKRYTCISDTEFSGVVNDNIELEFVYARNGLTAKDIPYNVYTSKPAYPDAPEAKTGDLDEKSKLPYIIVVILLAGVCAAAYIGRRRYYK